MAQRRSPRGPGRPRSLLQPDVEKTLITATSMGAPMHLAAAHAGISTRAFERWMERGYLETLARDEGQDPNPDEQLFVDFHDKITQARAQAGIRSLAAIQRAATGGAITEETTTTMPDGTVVKTVKRTAPDWKAGAWFLERQMRLDFGRSSEVAVTGPGGGPVQVQHTVDVEALAARIHASVERFALPAGSEDGDVVDAEVIDGD